MLNPMVPDDFQLIKLKEENKEGLAETSIRKRQATRQMKKLWLDRKVPYQISFELCKSSCMTMIFTLQKIGPQSEHSLIYISYPSPRYFWYIID